MTKIEIKSKRLQSHIQRKKEQDLRFSEKISDESIARSKDFAKRLIRIEQQCRIEIKDKSTEEIQNLFLDLPMDSHERKCMFSIFMNEHLQNLGMKRPKFKDTTVKEIYDLLNLET